MTITQLLTMIGRLYVENQILREQVVAQSRELESLRPPQQPPVPPATEGVS